MNRPIRLLVTGFGPFPGVPRNPSAELATRLAQSARLRRVLGRAPELLMLAVSYAAIPEQLAPALASGPDAILMVGVARRARTIRVEHRARNRASRLYPDASGRTHTLTLDPLGPARRQSPVAPHIAVGLRRAGISAQVSRDAGRYLCNASYYRVLAEGRPALFLHIPPLPHRASKRQRLLEEWLEAGEIAALALAASASRRHRVPPPR